MHSVFLQFVGVMVVLTSPAVPGAMVPVILYDCAVALTNATSVPLTFVMLTSDPGRTEATIGPRASRSIQEPTIHAMMM